MIAKQTTTQYKLSTYVKPTARGDVLGNAKSGASENLRVLQKNTSLPQKVTLSNFGQTPSAPSAFHPIQRAENFSSPAQRLGTTLSLL